MEQASEAGKLLAAFVDDLSNWYVRRSRRRFWRGDPAALATLHETLRTVTLLLAPLTPFVTERVWQDMVVAVDPAAASSVHLASYPEVDLTLVDDGLGRQMALARRLVELGRTARAELTGAAFTQQLDQVAEVLDVPALVRADRDALDVLLDRGGDDLVDRAVVPQVDHLGALALQDPPHDVDRGVVPVEQGGRGHEPDRVRGHVQLRVGH